MASKTIKRKKRDNSLFLGDLSCLTDRERQVAELINSGVESAGIAELMGLSIHTVKLHLSNARVKLDGKEPYGKKYASSPSRKASSKLFYHNNKEKIRLQQNENYKKKRELLGKTRNTPGRSRLPDEVYLVGDWNVLTDRQRQILELWLSGLKAVEIAESIGTSVNSVYSQLCYIRKKLSGQ